MKLSREMVKATQWRVDGDFYVMYQCRRCGDNFYEHAMQNAGLYGAEPKLCGVCRGDWSAARESHRNATIEASQ